MYRIAKVRKDERGNIIKIMLNDGRVIDNDSAVEMAELGHIENVNTGKTRDGNKTLRSDPDDTVDNNLDNLPQF